MTATPSRTSCDVQHRHHRRMARSRVLRPAVMLAFAAILASAHAPSAAAQDRKPYDNDLMRLSEILGAIHYLRELCGAGDGQLWRDQMRQIIDSEGTSALRRARLTRRFNQGYRSYSRTYNACTPSAKTAIERFIAEGVKIGEELLEKTP